jgi:hypothetical protein
MNPEFRQTLNTFSHNLESANQAAQENIYTFTQIYIDPCLSGLRSCLEDCTARCFPNRDDSIRRRRGRGRSRGRAENFFDFYDDWDEEEDVNDSALAWGDDELDSLLAGHGPQSPTQQPRRQRAMSYGSRGRRTGHAAPSDSEQDPTIIPSSSYLGFLERLPWRIGARVLRYKPSAANLQENPGGLRMADAEAEHLLEEEESSPSSKKGHGRQRSDTQASRSTTNSLSSRGDLIMSEEEDDAVPLDDEFAVMLGRRSTNVPSEDHSSGKTGSSGKRPGASRRSTRTASSKSLKTQRSSSRKSLTSPVSPSVDQVEAPSMQELRHEEEQARKEEEMEIEQKREAAQRLAMTKSLTSQDVKIPTAEVKPDPVEDGTETPSMTEITSPRPMSPNSTPEPQNEDVETPQQDSSNDRSRPDPP